MSNLAMMATELDTNFQAVADRMPEAVKLAGTNEITVLQELENIGTLQAQYIGNFCVRITAYFANARPARFYKDYELHWSPDSAGTLHDLQPTTAEDFDGCPLPLSDIAYAVHALCMDEHAEQFAQAA